MQLVRLILSGLVLLILTFTSEPLPAFSTDYSEVAIGAIIERSFSSSNLYVSTFLVGHKVAYSS